MNKSGAMVYLNIYDLSPINHFLYRFGIGFFHSGIEVHGIEYGFGAHEFPRSGVYKVEPRNCSGFIFRESVLLGNTDLSLSEFSSFIESLSAKYHGDTYDVITKNCNHFTDEACRLLTGNPIPRWVNRLAYVGSFCNCLQPEGIQIEAIRHVPECVSVTDDDGSDSDDLSRSSECEEEPCQRLLDIPNQIQMIEFELREPDTKTNKKTKPI